MDINNLPLLVELLSMYNSLTLAWFGSSSVRERRLTSGRFTAPRVTPELTYRTKASATMSC